jgi:predicted nucleotidyltransferase component of viral defense system
MGRDITNVAASVRQRLLNLARASKRPFNEVLQHFAMERFLYRLAASRYRDRFVLKGALMLMVWDVPISRPTMDIDLLAQIDNEIDVLTPVAREVCEQQVAPDGMVFDAKTVEASRIAEDAEYVGVRVRFRGMLGTARVSMQLDIGFGDAVIPKPVLSDYPAILDFPAPRVRGYSRESAIAEKCHAMVKRGLLNSRMKDYFDLWLLSGQFEFQGAFLAEAIRETFARRATVVLGEPVALTRAFASDIQKRAQWKAFVRKIRLEEVPTDLDEVVERVATFLKPVLAAITDGADFDARWTLPGAWAQRSPE